MPGARVERGDRVSLRTLERDDIPFWQRGYADPEIRYPTGNPEAKSRAQLEALFEDDGHTSFVVCLEDGTPESPDEGDVRRIGHVSVKLWGRTPTIGYWLVPEVHGNGYGTEAVSLVLEYAFRTYEAPAVRAKAFDYNTASRRLLESLGFKQEGRLRKDAFVDGEYRDGIVYGLLRREWRARTDRT